jgi:hypothetical protein
VRAPTGEPILPSPVCLLLGESDGEFSIPDLSDPLTAHVFGLICMMTAWSIAAWLLPEGFLMPKDDDGEF